MSVLIDPDRFQDPEQQFLASLDAPPEVTRLSGPQSGFYRPDPMWRDEVASRVDAYRARRGRRRPDPSSVLSFDFESPQPSELAELPVAVGGGPTWEATAQVVDMPPPAMPESNVIVFPRSLETFEPEPMAEELAEPVIETPRILEAPPEEVAPPVFGGVSLAPITLEERSVEVELEPVHLRVAARGLRIFSGLVDAVMVLIAAALFSMIFVQITDATPHSRIPLPFVVAIPCFFWAVYQYLFLVYAAATPGMHLANLRLSTFEGGLVRADQRRWRALALVGSCMSVGFGFAWALLDPEGLCWHDKITRTYLTQRTY